MNRRSEELESRKRTDLVAQTNRLSLSPKQPLHPAASSPADVKSPHYDEVFSLSPESALMILCAHVNKLAKLTGDIPSSTPPTGGNIIASQTTDDNCANLPSADNLLSNANPRTDAKHLDTFCPIVLIKSFYCKQISPISLADYLLRIHRYCPMSTAVYLATSQYIRHLAIVEKIIYVTPRNMHRLVLGGLRVAAKIVEDLCYQHRRFAKVGGVTERELAKLEISFSFLMDFELRVDAEMMFHEIEAYREESRFAIIVAWCWLGNTRRQTARNLSVSIVEINVLCVSQAM
ncbi:cyclin [Histoplasma capsulatum H143]|uniref:Cyclin n=2 Tax=Ajellomyces capsulatus TaxID=5037 RepID=C6HT36_AJECH|nr:cyclin [Histoplasma capsulatum H143]